MENRRIVDLTPTIPESTIEITKMYSTYSYFFSPTYTFRGEMHAAWELVYVELGEVEVETDEYTQILSKGQAILHKPWEFHKLRANNIASHILLLSFSLADDDVLLGVAGKVFDIENAQRHYIFDIIKNGIILFAGKNNIPPPVHAKSYR